ncbi:MAG: hypothetical protein GY895_16370 [Phycisphaera sp.]|nr:hypothetical protein [Phycisphaera sp.]
MSIDHSIRLTSYASLAAVATTGFVTEVQADLMIFDVGTTFTLQPVETFAGGSFAGSTFNGALRLEALGATVNFFGIRFGASNSTNSNSFANFSAWSANFGSGSTASGMIAIDPISKKARHFNAGDSVDSNNKGASNASGGKSKVFATGSKQKSAAKGVMDGQTFLGFSVPLDGLGAEAANYGWFDLTIGKDESGNLLLTINRWAYESDPGIAAQIPGDNPVPGVGGLLGLAMGAAGVRRRRERVA